MNERTLTYLMLAFMAIGLMLILFGVYLIILTNTVSESGTDGILKVAMLIAGGLFLLIPAKIFLTVMRLKNKEK